MARQVYIKPKDLEEHGLTRGCPRCDHQLRYGPGRTGKPHSQVCRARIMAELAKTTAGRLRISAATDRMDRTVGELGQQFRHDVPQGDNCGVEHRQPEAPPQFIPIPSQTPATVEYRDDHESREVPFC